METIVDHETWQLGAADEGLHQLPAPGGTGLTAGGVYPYRELPRYEIPCEVTAVVRAGNEEFAVAASGERDHRWGERDWWQISCFWSAADGRRAQFPRALCRFTADDGRTGYGWTEWNQPPGWQQHSWSFLPGPADRERADSEGAR